MSKRWHNKTDVIGLNAMMMSSAILHDLDERISGLKSFRFALLAVDLHAKTHETLRNEHDIISLPKVHQ